MLLIRGTDQAPYARSQKLLAHELYELGRFHLGLVWKTLIEIIELWTFYFQLAYRKVWHGFGRTLDEPFDRFIVGCQHTGITFQVRLFGGERDQLHVTGKRLAELRLVQDGHAQMKFVRAYVLKERRKKVIINSLVTLPPDKRLTSVIFFTSAMIKSSTAFVSIWGSSFMILLLINWKLRNRVVSSPPTIWLKMPVSVPTASN